MGISQLYLVFCKSMGKVRGGKCKISHFYYSYILRVVKITLHYSPRWEKCDILRFHLSKLSVGWQNDPYMTWWYQGVGACGHLPPPVRRESWQNQQFLAKLWIFSPRNSFCPLNMPRNPGKICWVLPRVLPLEFDYLLTEAVCSVCRVLSNI